MDSNMSVTVCVWTSVDAKDFFLKLLALFAWSTLIGKQTLAGCRPKGLSSAPSDSSGEFALLFEGTLNAAGEDNTNSGKVAQQMFSQLSFNFAKKAAFTPPEKVFEAFDKSKASAATDERN